MTAQLHHRCLGLAGLVCSLISAGTITPKAIAQTVYTFDAVYDTQVILTPIPSTDISTAFVSGFNPDAPYGLTNFLSINNYSRIDSNTGKLVFVQDPTEFALQGFPVGSDTLFGSGEDKLFGNSKATASFDFINRKLIGSGTITITGGAGRFSGATGFLNFSETESLDQDPALPLNGQAFLSGSFSTPQPIPEPRTNALVLSMCVIGIGLMFPQRYLLFKKPCLLPDK